MSAHLTRQQNQTNSNPYRQRQQSDSIHVSNPRPPCGGRHGWARLRGSSNRYFNPRSPHGERRGEIYAWRFRSRDFNPRSPHGERPFVHPGHAFFYDISIHALLTEGDATWNGYKTNGEQFQPTPSSRRATDDKTVKIEVTVISIHALLTEGDDQRAAV